MTFADLRFTFFRLTVHKTLLTLKPYTESQVLIDGLNTVKDLRTQRAEHSAGRSLTDGAMPETNEPHFWTIGNVSPVEPGSRVYGFLIGRNRRVIKKDLDDQNNFFKHGDEQFPFTFAFLDTENALCAIASSSEVSSGVEKIAEGLRTLLEKSSAISGDDGYAVDLELRVVHDPKDFLELLRQAYAVTEFSLTVLRPNPPNAARFAKSCEDYIDRIGGRNVQATAYGEHLDVPVIVEEANAASALGARASAKVKETPTSQPKPVTMNEDTPLSAVIRLEGEPQGQELSMWGQLLAKWREVFPPK